MPIIPSGNMQANFRISNDNNPHVSEVTLGLVSTGATPGPALAAALNATFADDIIPFLSTDVALVGTSIKVGPNNTGPTFDFSGVTEGEDAGVAVTANTAILVRKVTASGGRAGRGRMYIPGLRETRVDSGGNIDGSFLTDFQTALDGWFADLEALDVSPALFHDAGSPLSGATAILSFAVQQRAGTQRRRMR